MKILSLNIDEEFANLEFSIHELMILQKCLAVAPKTVPWDIFDAMVYGVSRPESLQLAEVFAEILTLATQGNAITLDNQLAQLLAISVDSCQLQISLKTIYGLRCVVVEALCGTCDEQIQEIINENEISLQPFIDFFNNEVIEEFEKDSLSRLTTKYRDQMLYDLGIAGKLFRTLHLPPEVPTRFCLDLNSHSIDFSLHRHKKLQSLFGLLSYSIRQGSNRIFVSKPPQWINYRSLLDVVAYLELVISSPIPDNKLEKYVEVLPNSLHQKQYKNLLIFQVLPKQDGGEDTLRLKVMVNLDPANEHKELEDNNLTIDEVVSKSNIYAFTESIKELFARSAVEV
jgi:hypothetical protein